MGIVPLPFIALPPQSFLFYELRGCERIEFWFEEKRKTATGSEPEEPEYPVLWVLVEDLYTFLDITHIFYGIENIRIIF